MRKKSRFDTSLFGCKSKPEIPARADETALMVDWDWIQEARWRDQCACVILINRTDHFLAEHIAGFERLLGEKLQEEGLGEFKDAEHGDRSRLFYLLNVERWGEAVVTIIAELTALRLLPDCTIGLAEPESETWRQVWPFQSSSQTP